MNDATTLEVHTHTTASDGEYTPTKLAELMLERGVDLWALTDHDTVAGCKEALSAVEDSELVFVPGIEVSAQLDEESIHVLGYGFDMEAPRLRAYGEELVGARRDRMEQMVERMVELGRQVTIEDVLEVAGGGNLCRPHLAKALLKQGHVDSIQKAFDRWLSDNGPAYVPMVRPSVEEAIEMIIDVGGMVVLAHPGRYSDLSEHFERWSELGLWGLEVRHPSHNSREEDRLIQLADRAGLGKTASNDWHGHKPGERERLGNVTFPEQWRQPFLARLKETTYFRSAK